MPEQKSLSTSQISDAFSKRARKYKEHLAKSGVGDVLRHLSRTIHNMQDTGIDIALDIRAGSYSNAFDLLFTTLAPESGRVAAYGFVHSGGATRLVSIVDLINDAPTCKLILSDHNTHESEGRMSWGACNKSSGTVFHFDNDEKTLSMLQEHLIAFAAQMHAVKTFDEENSFGKPSPQSAQGRLRGKPGLKLSRD